MHGLMTMQMRGKVADKVSLLGQARRRFLGLSPAEASFARRGFCAERNGDARQRLEQIGITFLSGYHAALEETGFVPLARRLATVDTDLQGFAFEGAAMGLALLDCFTPWRKDRWRTFTEGLAEPHIYMMHVGFGWALARLRRSVTPYLARLDPLLGWLVVDGYGFHEGYFGWPRYIERQAIPARLEGYELRVFDQGLGRSIWFCERRERRGGRECDRCFSFCATRRPVERRGPGLRLRRRLRRAAIELLRAAAGGHLPALAQGVAFAAKTRQRAANLNPHTETVCRLICGHSAEEAAAITDAALEDLRGEDGLPAYEVWRRRIQNKIAQLDIYFGGHNNMMIKDGAFRRQAAKLTAIILVFVVYGFARMPKASESELAKLAAGFRFSTAPLPAMSGETSRTIREVNPSLRRVAGWISTVGAAVALNDLDGDGLPNDACYVDTRIDKVIVAPVPGTPARYQPFTLDPLTLPYDAATMAPMGCLPGDFNEDGLQDVLAYYWGRTPVAFIKRDRGSLNVDSYTRSEVVPGGARWYTNAATLADIDGDGHTDLIIGNFFPDGARILDARAIVADGMQDSMSLAQNGGRKHLLLWKAPAAGAPLQFEEVHGALDEQSAQGWALAIAAADLDGDLLPEVYFANDFGPDRLLHNRSTPGQPRFELLEGRRSFTTTKSKVLGRDSYKGMGVDFGDLNGDGWPDIYVSNITQEYGLEESNFVFLSTGHTELMKKGVAPYIDRSESMGLSRSGWGWESRLADFNNDGVLEALQATGFLKGNVNRWPELHEVVTATINCSATRVVGPSFKPAMT